MDLTLAVINSNSVILYNRSCFLISKYLLYFTLAFCSCDANAFPQFSITTPPHSHSHTLFCPGPLLDLLVHTKECPFTVNVCLLASFNQPEEGMGMFCKCTVWLWRVTRMKTSSVDFYTLDQWCWAKVTVGLTNTASHNTGWINIEEMGKDC